MNYALALHDQSPINAVTKEAQIIEMQFDER